MHIYKNNWIYYSSVFTFLFYYFILSVLDILNQIKHDYPVLFRSNMDIRTIYWNITINYFFDWLSFMNEFTV